MRNQSILLCATVIWYDHNITVHCSYPVMPRADLFISPPQRAARLIATVLLLCAAWPFQYMVSFLSVYTEELNCPVPVHVNALFWVPVVFWRDFRDAKMTRESLWSYTVSSTCKLSYTFLLQEMLVSFGNFYWFVYVFLTYAWT